MQEDNSAKIDPQEIIDRLERLILLLEKRIKLTNAHEKECKNPFNN